MKIYKNQYNNKNAPTIEERFWSYVNKKPGQGRNLDCWQWTGHTQKYGRFQHAGKKMGAHRFSYILNIGEIPDGLWVLHKCDNPPCVNPKHLFLGTRQDNVDDRVSKGRNNHNYKLIREQIEEIRMLENLIPRRHIQNIYGISKATVQKILAHKGSYIE